MEHAHEITSASCCRAAKVKVTDHPDSLGEDLARVETVRDALGSQRAIRVDANGLSSTYTAINVISQLDRAANELEYVQQPCPTIEELAIVRRTVNVPIVADESIRRADDPLQVTVAGDADIAVIKYTLLGGVRPLLADRRSR